MQQLHIAAEIWLVVQCFQYLLGDIGCVQCAAGVQLLQFFIAAVYDFVNCDKSWERKMKQQKFLPAHYSIL